MRVLIRSSLATSHQRSRSADFVSKLALSVASSEAQKGWRDLRCRKIIFGYHWCHCLSVLPGLMEIHVSCADSFHRQVESAADIVELVQYGMRHRHEDATLIHAHSSRSHLIVTLTVSTYPRGAPTTTPNASRSASPVPDLPSPGWRINVSQLCCNFFCKIFEFIITLNISAIFIG